jgi:hypothetical protein
MKAVDYGQHTSAITAFVSTNSICQGSQVPILWPLIFATKHEICFAHSSFKWANLASHNAGVTVAIIGFSKQLNKTRKLYSIAEDGSVLVKDVAQINAYLVPSSNVIVMKASRSLSGLNDMDFGNKPVDGGHLFLNKDDLNVFEITDKQQNRFVRHFIGAAEFINGLQRYCLWIDDRDLEEALAVKSIRNRIENVRAVRLASRDKGANEMAARAHQMREMNESGVSTIVVPRVSSENRPYLPVGYTTAGTIVGDSAFALFDAPLWNMSLIASRLHLVWIATVCGKLETRYRYSNTLGWNTFPVPTLTDKNKVDLTRCAEDILLAREVHYPATIADLYDPETMPANLREAHERNDETLERIYIGRRFRNDTERLEKLFELYTKMTAAKPATKNKKA